MIERIVAAALLGLVLAPGAVARAADGPAGDSESLATGDGADAGAAAGGTDASPKDRDGESEPDEDDGEGEEGEGADEAKTEEAEDTKGKGGKGGRVGKGKPGKDGKNRAEVRWEPGEGIAVRSHEPKASVQFSAWLRPTLVIDVPTPGASPSARVVSGTLDRARVSAAFELPHGFDGEVGLRLDDLDIALTDVFVRWKPLDAFAVRLGRQRVPFGRERLTSSRAYPFVERGSPSALTTGRAFGAQIESRLLDDRLRITVGLYQGPASTTFDDDRNADLVGRLSFAPAPAFALGIGGSARFRPDGIEGLGGMDGVAGSLLESRPFIGAAGGGGLDAVVSGGPLRVLLEGQVLREGLTVGTATGHLVAAAGQLLVGVAPLGTRDDAAAGGSIGSGLEILGRVDVLHLAPAPGDRAPATRLGVSAGVLGAPWPWLRLAAEVEIARRFGLGQDSDADTRIVFSATLGT